ncbi:MAG: hypothetical protein VW576_05025 [Opitutae bacterium]
MSKFYILAIWLLTIGIAYWIGRSGESQQHYYDGETTLGDRPIEVDLSMLPNPDFKEANAPESKAFARGPSPKEDVSIPASDGSVQLTRSMSSMAELQSSHPINRLRAFAELLNTPNSQSIETALRAYESLPGGSGRFSELKMLAFAWGQVDPKAALSWAKEQEHWEEHLASSSILDSWAREDPDAAVVWAKENFEGEENPYFVGIINGLSESSLPKATDLMTELPYGRVRGRAAHLLFEKVWSRGEEVALHWAEHLPEGSLQNFAYGELGEKVVREDSHRAIQWIESMEESSLKSAVTDKVAKEMARENPVETASWVDSLPAGESKIKAMNQLAEMWTRKDPVATAEWINQMPSDVNKDPLIETLVNKIHKTDPQTALVWAETIANPERRRFMTEKVIKVIKTEKFPRDQPE